MRVSRKIKKKISGPNRQQVNQERKERARSRGGRLSMGLIPQQPRQAVPSGRDMRTREASDADWDVPTARRGAAAWP